MSQSLAMLQPQFPLSPNKNIADDTLAFFTAVIPPLEGEFLYGYDPNEFAGLAIGDVVEVPIGKRVTSAFITSINSDKELASKKEMDEKGVRIRAIPADSPRVRAFNQEHLAFYDWVARYYAEPLSKILDLAVPTPATGKPLLGYRLTAAQTGGTEHPPKRSRAQSAVLEFLSQSGHAVEAKDIQASCGASAATIRTLVQRGLLERVPLTHVHDVHSAPDPTLIQAPILNEEQLKAVDAIRAHHGTFSTTLLQGVTGSGKTEVYLSLILEALIKGLSALVIVPEIALTPQLTERFISRLQQPVAVLHSNLTPKERWRHWSDLVSGRVQVAIGARSAIFAPVSNLGILVVDEEHDSSFKQGEGIRYHARDLALVRAKLSSCPVILGSATPSLESYNNAKNGKYLHLRLTHKYHDAATSEFKIIDLNKVKPWEMKSKSISPDFFSGLQSALVRGGQAFILYNRRGFASYLQCSSCEHVVGCPHCSVTLTYHRNIHSLICHQCSFTMVPPSLCNSCGTRETIDPAAESVFTHRGSGTERIHEELQLLFPTARIAVLDRDTASSVQDYIEILRRVREREVDILVGTQMIAKGHDLPGVTFVGIVDCDVGLHIPDFRAAERSFQLLTQVSGRAGRRSEQGRVILQTRVPTHPSLVLTAANDYDSFAEQELIMRRELHYPPFYKILRIISSAPEKTLALKHAAELARSAHVLSGPIPIQILGPAPAPIEKIRTMWRYHILLRSSSIASLQHAMKQLKRVHHTKGDIRISYDLDPHDML